MKLGLVGRILIAGAVVGALLLVKLALFLIVVTGLRDGSDIQAQAVSTIAAAVRLEHLASDLDTGQQPDAARRALPVAAARLRAQVAGTPRERDAVALAAAVRAYLADGVARSPDGRRRVAAIRTQVARLVATEEQRAADAQEQVHADARGGIITGIGGLVVTALLVLAFAAYFLRAAVWPLRRLSEGTGRLSRGELSTRVSEDGAGEVADLARAFNAMAASIQRSGAELQRQVSVTQTVLDSTIDGICLTDADGEIVLANRPLIGFVRDLELPLGSNAQERLLAVAHRFTDPDRYRRSISRIQPGLTEPTMDEFTFADSRRSFQGFTTPVLDDAGRLTGRVWTLREVTAERAADQLKDDFVATVSHELRTPLTSIVGFLELLLEEDAGPLSDEQRRFLEIVMRSSQRLMRQVGDLLFIAQIDAAGLKLSPERVDLAALVRDSVEQVAALARRRQIALSVEADGALELTCDRGRIAQVVSNLLSNAIKFTPSGGSVGVRVFGDDGAGVVEIEDSGIGIPELERDRLFERFFRSSRATEHAIQGTGLGLAISKAIVLAHGGTIDASPGPERGTCFRFELPPVPAPAGLLA
jgi:signal transduction histidine kinase/HAMP domain-containing protein